MMHMTAYETIMVVLGLTGLLISSNMLLIALLKYLDKRDKKKKASPVYHPQERRSINMNQ